MKMATFAATWLKRQYYQWYLIGISGPFSLKSQKFMNSVISGDFADFLVLALEIIEICFIITTFSHPWRVGVNS